MNGMMHSSANSPSRMWNSACAPGPKVFSVADCLFGLAMAVVLPSQNSELSESILRTMALVATMQMQPTTLCNSPAAALMPRLWVLA